MTLLLQLNHVKYHAGEKEILNIASFQLEQNEFKGIMGPNGAGKSSLLKVMAFLEKHTSGGILYREETVSANSLPIETRRKFAVAMQQSLLLDSSVFQNISLALRLRSVPKKIIKEKTELWMERFQISHIARKNARLLSGGEAQRVNLARAMIVEPEILFLDEPFSALDFPTKIKLMEDFKKITAQTGTSCLFVSHDLSEIQYLTSRLAVMIDGQIIQEGNTRDVIDRPNKLAATFLNEWKRFYQLTTREQMV